MDSGQWAVGISRTLFIQAAIWASAAAWVRDVFAFSREAVREAARDGDDGGGGCSGSRGIRSSSVSTPVRRSAGSLAWFGGSSSPLEKRSSSKAVRVSSRNNNDAMRV